MAQISINHLPGSSMGVFMTSLVGTDTWGKEAVEIYQYLGCNVALTYTITRTISSFTVFGYDFARN